MTFEISFPSPVHTIMIAKEMQMMSPDKDEIEVETKYEEVRMDIDEDEFNVLQRLVVIPRELFKTFRKKICKWRDI